MVGRIQRRQHPWTAAAFIAWPMIWLGRIHLSGAFHPNPKAGLTIRQALKLPRRPTSSSALSYQWWDEEYWFREDIHTLGNTGLTGGLHAALAPLSTRLIDLVAYEGRNVRETIARDIVQSVLEHRRLVKSSGNGGEESEKPLRIMDMGCGVGVSTAALSSAVRNKANAAAVLGVDTSPEMLAIARVKEREREGLRSLLLATAKTNVDTSFAESNAQATGLPSNSFDLVTIMYVLHEVPFVGRHRILKEARRLLKPGGILAVVDISEDYQPSPAMLSGEPYVLEYQQHFRKQLASLRGFERKRSVRDVVPGHVVVHELVRADPWWSNGGIRRAIEFGHLHGYIWNRELDVRIRGRNKEDGL